MPDDPVEKDQDNPASSASYVSCFKACEKSPDSIKLLMEESTSYCHVPYLRMFSTAAFLNSSVNVALGDA
jgi:hypothetical protein